MSKEVMRRDFREVSSTCEILDKRQVEIKKARWAQVMTVCVKFHMSVKKLEKYRPTKTLQAGSIYMAVFQRIVISLILNFFTFTVHPAVDML